MRFLDVVILDWYDNIIKAFCKKGDDWYYCTLIQMDKVGNEKIYLCIKLIYFLDHNLLLKIIEKNSISLHWYDYYALLNQVFVNNSALIIKSTDLIAGENIVLDEVHNLALDGILFCDFPDVFDKIERNKDLQKIIFKYKI